MDLREAANEFSIDKKQLLQEAQRVTAAMESGIKGETSSLSMLPSFLSLPEGDEKGEFFALDFGGSNIRIAKVVLSDGEIKTKKHIKKNLKELSSGLTGGTEELFEKIAVMINDFAEREDGYLGHTFSYPVLQTGVNDAKLKKWTKEINFSESRDFDINGLLYDKLKALGRSGIKPSVILNDTTAVIMSTAYKCRCKNVIGSICGTGHNTCYYEPAKKMVLNLESGNFNPVCRNEFDILLDERSFSKGEQLLEKMVAGDYLAKLVCIVMEKTGLDTSLYKVDTAKDVSDILAYESHVLYPLARNIVKRAAALISAEYLGIYEYLEKNAAGFEIIAIDGSIYEKMPFFKNDMEYFLQTIFKKQLKIISGQGESLNGAAVACATLL